ncbi:DUF6755 family protein [Pendulispora albinea]|uniref:Uncharacterized protein n=1 Tax=Pendulispora albinea TaxID=2741071 RepID=A0ABZ2LS34_9BACT
MVISRHFSRQQRSAVLYGILCFVLTLVALQLWLLTATVDAWLGGDDSIVWPALGASSVCLSFNLGLLRHLRIE